MPTPNTLTQLDWAMKENYTYKVAMAQFMQDNVLLSMLETEESVEGNPSKVALITGDGAGVSADLAASESSATGITGKAFMIEHADILGTVPILEKTLKATGQNGTLLMNYVKNEMDAKLNAMGRLAGRLLHGNGGGALARGASLSTNTFTLTNAADAVSFWPGQQLVFSTADGTGGADALKGGSPGYLIVQSVDYDLGTVTTDAVAGVTSVAGTDYIFLRGTFAGAVSQTLIFKGIAAWFTAAAPTDTFWGVARTGTQLGGFRVPTALQTGPVVQRLQQAAMQGNTAYGATPRTAVIHPTQFLSAATDLQNAGIRELKNLNMTTGQAGYRTLEVITTYGPMDVVGDRFCDPLRATLLDLKTIKLRHLGGELIYRVADEQGNYMTRLAASEGLGWKYNLASFCNLACNAPWKSGNTPLAVVT